MKCISNSIYLLAQGLHRVSLSGAIVGPQQFFCSLSLHGEPDAADFQKGRNLQSWQLHRIGDSCLIEVRSPVELLVAMVAPSRAHVDGAEVIIEPVELATVEPQPIVNTNAGNARAEAQFLDILGHIEKRGDARFASGDWIGNFGEKLRIEGLSIYWPDCPPGMALSYRASLANGDQTSWSPMGTFVGSRGRSQAITSLSLALNGRQATAWRLEVEAIFTGSGSSAAINPAPDTAVELSGPTGRDSLVGLRLSIVPADSGDNSGAA